MSIFRRHGSISLRHGSISVVRDSISSVSDSVSAARESISSAHEPVSTVYSAQAAGDEALGFGLFAAAFKHAGKDATFVLFRFATGFFFGVGEALGGDVHGFGESLSGVGTDGGAVVFVGGGDLDLGIVAHDLWLDKNDQFLP